MKHMVVVMLATTLLVTGCLPDPPEPAFQVTLRLSPTPALIGPTRLIVDVADVEGDPVAGLAVFIEGLPAQSADRTVVTSDAVDEGAGRYVVPGFDLEVGGPWTLTVTVSDSSGTSTTRAFPISVYGGS